MNLTFKIHSICDDNIGTGASMFGILADHGHSVISMEVQKHGKTTDVYMEILNIEKKKSKEEIITLLTAVDDVKAIRLIKTLPKEEKEQQLQTVLDNVTNGIISINEKGEVLTINKVAKEFIPHERYENILGQQISQISFPDLTLLKCLDGISFENVKRDVNTPHGRFHFFVTAKPILNSAGRIIGAVEVMTDMKKIKELVQSVVQPRQISFSDIVGISPAIRNAIAYAQQVASSDAIISLRGASGTGKEIFAQAIHTESGREGPFVPVNCAAIPENLFESELFGYVEGAFTGANTKGKTGLFESAKGGTLFLDEISEIPLVCQAKLLRVIQDKSVRRVGDTREIPITARIITATNRDLEKMVKENNFREDLYYRINVLPIFIPALRERREDIELLIEHVLFKLNSNLNRHPQSFSDEAIFKLMQHNWNGNVRELINVVERASILTNTSKITKDKVFLGFDIHSKDQLNHQFGFAGEEIKSLPDATANFEKQIIIKILKEQPSIRKAARKLNIAHTTLLNKIKKYQIEVGH